MRMLLARAGLMLLVPLPLAAAGHAAPPDLGYVGVIAYQHGGRESDRLACDSLALIKVIYEAGKDNVFLMHPKFEELAEVEGRRGTPQCRSGTYGAVRVADDPVLLGPVANPVGEAELFIWALHVDDSPKGRSEDYWLLYVDTPKPRPWLQVGESI